MGAAGMGLKHQCIVTPAMDDMLLLSAGRHGDIHRIVAGWQYGHTEGEPGAQIQFDEVLFRKTGEATFQVGKPFLSTPIKASIVKQTRGPKVIAFRFKRRKKVRVKKGHRQDMTVIRIEAI